MVDVRSSACRTRSSATRTALRQVLVQPGGQRHQVHRPRRGRRARRADAGPRSDRASLHFSVIDTGIGISPREAGSRSSSRSRRPTARRRAQYGGTGLGLTICQQLVRADGRAHLGRERTATRQRVPFRRDAAGQPAAVAPQFLPQPDELVDMSALVVDDNATNRRILVELLSSWGIRAMATADGVEALTRRRAKPRVPSRSR